MPPREPDAILPDLPEDPDTAEVRAERLWMAAHRVVDVPLERALPCVRPARPEELRDPMALLMFRDRKARLGIFRAAVLARPPGHARQSLMGVVDPARLAGSASDAASPFPSVRSQPQAGADGRLPR